ncbi:MAG: alpha-glucosidase C-terminal domain-containing protein [Kineosporiaceae bacterium]
MNNLSGTPQATRIRLPQHTAGAQLTDIFGGTGFEPVPEDAELAITMGSRNFYWLTVSGDGQR